MAKQNTIRVLKHLVLAALIAAAVAFLQTVSTDGATIFGTEPYWPVIAAGLTLGVAELEAWEGRVEKSG